MTSLYFTMGLIDHTFPAVALDLGGCHKSILTVLPLAQYSENAVKVYTKTMANNQNLTPWKPGQSGNALGKPKGIKHVSTWVNELLNDENFLADISINGNVTRYKGAPMKAIIMAQIGLAMEGNTQAFDKLMKHATINQTDNKVSLFSETVRRERVDYNI